MKDRTLVKSYLLYKGKVSGAILEWTEDGELGAIVEGNKVTLRRENCGEVVLSVKNIHALKILSGHWKKLRNDWFWYERFMCLTSGKNHGRHGWQYMLPHKEKRLESFPEKSKIPTWDDYGDVRSSFKGKQLAEPGIIQTHVLQRVDGVPKEGKNQITGGVFYLRDKFAVEARRFKLTLKIDEDEIYIEDEEINFIIELSDFIRKLGVQK